jgi:hypothetical protein
LQDAARLVEHYDRWLEEFEAVRESKKPNLDEAFVFVGPKGYPFPSDSETRFKEAFTSHWRKLYGDSRS